MDIRFVIGNGVSRKKQPLKKLKEHGKVYACNYAAVDIPCDHGIAVDRAMIFDLLSQYNLDCKLWSRKKWCNTLSHSTTIHPLPDQIYSPQVRWDAERHWGSGTHAVWKAAQDDADIVVMLGFDIWNKGTSNNLYANRDHYSADPVDPRCWVYQLQQTFLKHPNTSFVNIQGARWKVPEEWQHLENFSKDTYKNLWEWLNA
jgi:hypothetical protein